MKIALFGKKIDDNLVDVFSSILKAFDNHRCALSIYAPFYREISKILDLKREYPLFSTREELERQADLLVSLGGDGTLLDVVVLVQDSQIPVLGVNIGRLGFLPTASVENFGMTLEMLKNRRFEIETRSLLRLTTEERLFGDLNYALNEISILTHYPSRMLSLSTWIDDYFLNNYWGDGLIVATPTGSTAYSMSCGGDILTPSSKNFIITPIAPHNLTVRALIVSENSKIKVHVNSSKETQYIIAMDSRSVIVDKPIDIFIEKEKFGFNLIRMEGSDFFQTLRSKLNWGLDQRN
ncbi:NAD kinase [Bacteroidales bacterium OttesenSCG-928-J16]|nr:NAD kinase [Bacteroidales bacterium OttesenSCG-928-J16]